MQVAGVHARRPKALIHSVLILWSSIGRADPLFAVSDEAYGVGRVAEASLRSFAVSRVLPAFPGDAIAKRATGVGVARVEVDERGAVSRVDVLTAPTRSIEQAIERAVKQWRFSPVTLGGRPYRVSGKVTFYFVMERGRGVVLNPEGAGYLGQWPEKERAAK